MLNAKRLCVLWLGTLTAGLLVGCGDDGREIQIQYDRPPQYQISPAVRKIAIVQFGAEEGTEKKWSEIATDKLASVMDESNKRFGRYELVDRKRVAAIMDERDFQMAVADEASAVKFGKIASVDAMIYGTVYVTSESKIEEKQIPVPTGQGFGVRMETIQSTRYLSTAAVTFTMVDVQTSKTICTVNTLRKYDSDDKNADRRYKQYEGNLNAITTLMVEDCVEEFVGKVSPHQITVRINLRKVKSDPAKDGNAFAAEGEYQDAILMYQAGLREKPEDHGAMFNIGVCHEALGQLDQAEQWYSKALSYETESEYIKARRRVRLEE
jgi:tetratricopeptide (TPR) repeat protein